MFHSRRQLACISRRALLLTARSFATTTKPRWYGKDAIDLLLEEQQKIGSLLRQLDATPDRELRSAISDQLVREVALHAYVKEKVLYPKVRRYVPGGDEYFHQMYEQNRTIDDAVEKLRQVSHWDSRYSEELEKLRKAVESNLKLEQESVFPAVRSVLKDNLWTMAVSVDKERELAPAVPVHPYHIIDPIGTQACDVN